MGNCLSILSWVKQVDRVRALHLKPWFSLGLFIFFFVSQNQAKAQMPNSSLLDSILNTKPILKKVAAQAEKYRLQIIYTSISRNSKGEVSFTPHYFNVNPKTYFYCASLIKLPTAIIALEKLQALNAKGITPNTTLLTDSCLPCMNKVVKDTNALNQLPTLANYIKEMLLVSDNAAYSRVYEFCGTDLLNQRVKEWGCKHTYIINRYDGRCYQENNFNTNPIRFINSKGELLYEQACAKGKPIQSLNVCNKTVGKAYYNNKNKLVKHAKNFEGMNECSLLDMQLILQKIISASPDLKWSEADRQLVLRYLSLYPRESLMPRYAGKAYYDSFKKYLIHGDSKKTITNPSLRLLNIVGQSYGFMSDCAYIIDFETKTEFMLSVALYANDDEIINDGRYDYNTIALPFLGELGRSLLAYSRQQSKGYWPQALLDLKQLIDKPE